MQTQYLNNTFNDIDELLKVLNREKLLLKEMFTKRNEFSYPYEYALDLVDNENARLSALIDYSILRLDGACVEIEDLYINFFEQVLSVNEEINVSQIDEGMSGLKDNINYYLKETNESRKYNYLRSVKSSLRRIEQNLIRNVVDMRRNVEYTFKNEQNFQIKQDKLERLNEKRESIMLLIEKMDDLLNKEQTFFTVGMDESLKTARNSMKVTMNNCRHNLIETQTQIIGYINKIKYNSNVNEHIRKLKYLRDQFELEAKTNIREVLYDNNDVIFEPQPRSSIKLSIDKLQSDDQIFELIRKTIGAAKKKKQRNNRAPAIDFSEIDNADKQEVFINIDEVYNAFSASSNNLFDFILNYTFPRMLSFDEKITIFCQLVSQYEKSLTMQDETSSGNGVEYLVIYNK